MTKFDCATDSMSASAEKGSKLSVNGWPASGQVHSTRQFASTLQERAGSTQTASLKGLYRTLIYLRRKAGTLVSGVRQLLELKGGALTGHPADHNSKRYRKQRNLDLWAWRTRGHVQIQLHGSLTLCTLRKLMSVDQQGRPAMCPCVLTEEPTATPIDLQCRK